MKAEYYPEVDMLNIDFAEGKGVESAEVSDGVVFTYDADGKVVAIEIDNASKRLRLDDEVDVEVKVF